jgi:carboxypeptidase C (cathepsin A)
MIFLDSPVGVGYSYGSAKVSDSTQTCVLQDLFHLSLQRLTRSRFAPLLATQSYLIMSPSRTHNDIDILTTSSAEDVYAFMQLLYLKFPKLINNDFVVSGESYAGTYIPHIGSFIHSSNLNLPTKSSQIIPLKSLLIGNGLTNSLLQFPKIIDHSCGDSKFAIFDETTCTSMKNKVPTCEKLTQYCYDSPSRFTCVPGMFLLLPVVVSCEA